MKSHSWGISRDIGYKGEALLASLLPDAIHVNKDRDVCNKWDVEWNGLLLDAKTTTAPREPAMFSGSTTFLTDDVIFVYIDISDRLNHRFWVRHSQQGFRTSQHRHLSMSATDLPKAIMDCHKNYSQIYKKTVDNVHS